MKGLFAAYSFAASPPLTDGEPLYGASFVKKFGSATHVLSFVSFFVRSESPFLRPDPRQRQAVA
ncbi:hypothetical protein, partial [Bradyrhizobium sp. Mp27]|uniref:hypothetical protein n=1 Tax=Bradyrhizobium sp. Mp27 TaxID=3042157 RepID=UPI00248B652F